VNFRVKCVSNRKITADLELKFRVSFLFASPLAQALPAGGEDAVQRCAVPEGMMNEVEHMQAIPMTLRGAEKLREELDFLKSVRRPEIIAAIADAREHGDLKENAEYHAAREQQGFCEGRIKDIEAKLSNAQVIDVTKMPNNGRVIFGATVQVLNLDSDEEQTYRIVGDDEADFKQNLISVNSPIARGLIGKEQDDVVTIRTPGGEVEYEIIKVDYL